MQWKGRKPLWKRTRSRPYCLIEEKQFWLWRERKDRERRAKIAAGENMPQCLKNEEEKLEFKEGTTGIRRNSCMIRKDRRRNEKKEEKSCCNHTQREWGRDEESDESKDDGSYGELNEEMKNNPSQDTEEGGSNEKSREEK
jgi:hypothetical protein